MPVQPYCCHLLKADRIVGLLDANGLKDSEDLIVNRIRMDMVNRGEMMSIADVKDILQLNVIGAVPDDENIVVATNKGQPLVGDSSMAFWKPCSIPAGQSSNM